MREKRQARFDALSAKIESAFKDMPAAEVDALVAEAMLAVRPLYRPAKPDAKRRTARTTHKQ